jgi:hypothetical protein
MRAAAFLAIMTIATPAAAQTLQGPLLQGPGSLLAGQSLQSQTQLNLLQHDLLAQQQLAQQHQIAQQNELAAMDARLRAQQAMDDVRATNRQANIPAYAGAPPTNLRLDDYASIPDDRLAASNKRVEHAAKNRR